MEIPVLSLLQVLKGVAVATKAVQNLVQPVEAWISQQCAQTVEKLSSDPADSAVSDSTATLSVEGWCDRIASRLTTCENGVQQLARITLGVAILREKSRRNISTTSEELDVVWSLIYDAITGPQITGVNYSAVRSSQGFIAMPLCSLVEDGCIDELFRFHVWLPDGERGVSQASVHSHQPFAQSWILAGYGIDHSYEVERTRDSESATHAEYIPSWTAAGQTGSAYQTHQQSSTITNTGKFLRVTPTGSEKHTCDMSYSIPAGQYHRSEVPADKFHATLFFFDSHRGFIKNAGIAGPKEGQSYVQPRDPAGLTASALAKIVNATRSSEKSHDVHNVNEN